MVDVISEFGAGLGDVITLIYNSDRYTRLDHLKPKEKAMIVLMSHNPHSKELFLWHPKASQFDIHDVGFWWPWEDQQKRAQHGLPPAQPLHLTPQGSVKFYPSPEDFKVLDTLTSFPYIVVNTAAGGVDRNIPKHIYDDAVRTICEDGQRNHEFRAVVVGRRYSPEKRTEHDFIPRPGLVNLIDRLTVPGTIELIARSRGVFCCHSAICLIAWYLKKPVFLTYPKEVGEREFGKPPHQYTLGKDWPTTIHLEFDKYSNREMKRFLEISARASL
jgi:ADP-heptose:LPS heptosyltransferase